MVDRGVDTAAREKTQAIIDQYFSLENPIEVDSDEKLEALLADSNKMEGLLDYLRVFNELEEESLAPVKAHYNLGEEISKAEEAKK